MRNGRWGALALGFVLAWAGGCSPSKEKVSARAGSGPSCTDILSKANSSTGKSGRRVLAIFGASWCGDCVRVKRLLHRSDVGGILGKYFLPVTMNIFEKGDAEAAADTPGARIWLKTHGIEAALPTLVILGGQGEIVVESSHPSKALRLPPLGGSTLSYTWVETFLRMISEGAPGMATADLKRLRGLLEKDIERTFG